MDKRQLAEGITGLTISAAFEGLAEALRHVRETDREHFDERLSKIEATTIRGIRNTILDGIPEADQVALIEPATGIIRAFFGKVRRGEV